MKTSIEMLLDLDAGMEEMAPTGRGRQLIGLGLKADGVIVGDHSFMFGGQDAFEVQFVGDRSPGGAGIRGLLGKSFLVFGDEDAIEIFGGGFTVFDSLMGEFGDESLLEAAVEALAPSAGLGAVSKDESDRELRHGAFEMGLLDLGSLFNMGPAVAGGCELAGHIEIEGRGQAEFFEHPIADLEASVAVLVGLEFTPEGFSGGVIAGKEQAHFGAVVSEPGMGRAVEEEEFAFVFPALTPSAMLFKPALSFTHPERSHPEPEGLGAELNFMLLGEGVGKMREIIVLIFVARQADNLLFDRGRDRVGRLAAGVQVDDPGRAFALDPLLQALNLTDGNPQGIRRLLIVQGSLERRFNRLIPFCLCQS